MRNVWGVVKNWTLYGMLAQYPAHTASVGLTAVRPYSGENLSMSNEGNIVYLNGELVPESRTGISIHDRGFLYGDALFDATQTFNGRPFKLREHIDQRMRWKYGNGPEGADKCLSALCTGFGQQSVTGHMT